MFKVFEFISSIHAFMTLQDVSFNHAMNLAMQQLTREQILNVRDGCYRLAEHLTGYINEMDAREEMADDVDSESDSPF